MDDSDFQKEAFGQLNKIQLVFWTIMFVGFAADVSVDKSSLDLAREQLASIKDAALKWNDSWLTLHASKMVETSRGANVTPQQFRFTVGPPNESVLIELPVTEFQIRPLPAALELVTREHNKPSRFGFRRAPSIDSPGTLSDFWKIWDALREKMNIYTRFDPVEAATFISTRDHAHFPKTASRVSSVAADSKALQPKYRLTGNVFEIHPDNLEDLKKLEPTHMIIADWDLDGKRWFVQFFVKGKSDLRLNGQEAFIAEHGGSWHLGPARSVFKDLYSIADNFADLPFDKIRSILDSEAQRYGERLSLFGVNLPAGQLAVWSLSLTTVVYAYFVTMLLGVMRHLRTNVDIIDYPWLGILPGKVALFASLISLCIFPAIFGVVKATAICQLPSLGNATKISLAAVAVFLLFSSLVAARAILSLRRRRI